MIAGLLYWGYLDDQGIIHVKRYTGDNAIQNAEKCEWVKGIFDVFEAIDLEDAKKKCYDKYKEVQ